MGAEPAGLGAELTVQRAHNAVERGQVDVCAMCAGARVAWRGIGLYGGRVG